MGVAAYLRIDGDPAGAQAALRARYPRHAHVAGAAFVGVEFPVDDPVAPEADLAALSLERGADVLWLGRQRMVDAFQFLHWRAGRLRRALVFGCFEQERMWERSEGSAEPWEAEALFSQRILDGVLGDAETDAERDEARRIWAGREISPGAILPPVDALETARAAAEFYGLPGW